MLAREYGYQVSQTPAGEVTPEPLASLDAWIAASEAKDWTTFAFFLGGVPLAIGGGFWAGFGAAVLGAILGTSVLAGIIEAFSKNQIREVRVRRNILAEQPWQVWPCRLLDATGSLPRRILLLAPDGTVAAAYQNLPESAWLGMTDGRGIIWFAGDIRLNAMAAMPGGDPFWSIEPVPVPPVAGALQGEVQEQLVRAAVQFTFDQWFS
ncbi:hypothetical protein EDD96_6844 [Streptomyces sp. Ag109_G2-6]|nr:hypothetical protein EDD96_6844 [Streptomyces sp. Ag109_G2-6]